MRIISALISLFLAFLLLMTGARFLLLLFDANRSSEIVDWVLRKSDFWVKPFFGIIENRDVGTAGFLEPASLIAFAVYLVVGSIVLGVLRAADHGGIGWGGRRHWGHA
jgi:hypothetical protein